MFVPCLTVTHNYVSVDEMISEVDLDGDGRIDFEGNASPPQSLAVSTSL